MPEPSYTSRPNVVIMIVDDLAFGDLSCHGNPHTQTTRLDELHGDSARVTRCLSGPLCTPARASLLTGRHPFRTRAYDTYLGRSNLDGEEVTLAHLLAQQGYRTGLFGKWHLGDAAPNDPNTMGFQEALYHTSGGLRQPGNVYGRNSYFDPELIHNGHRVVREGYCTDIFTDATCQFIRESQEPFFCYLGFNAVHSPFEIVENWAEPFRKQGLPEVWCRVYGMLQNLDENVGKLLDCLEIEGKRDNTIVYFTSDHGPCASANVEGKPRFNAGLRGIKGGFYEGGVRVPAFWSGKGWPARDIDALSNPIDVLPTLAKACGFELPADRKLDGMDLTPQLEGGADAAFDGRQLCMQWHRGARPIRWMNAMCADPRYKWYSVRPGEEELYDLLEDPAESRNIAAGQPERVQSMRIVYEAWFDEVCVERGLLDAERDPGAPIVILPDGPPTWLTWQDWVPYCEQEGFSVHQPGSWLVNIAVAADYRVVIDLEPGTHPETLHFSFADVGRTLPVPPKTETLALDVALPAACDSLHCYFTEKSRRIGCQSLSLRGANT